jgi:hypothetical protein
MLSARDPKPESEKFPVNVPVLREVAWKTGGATDTTGLGKSAALTTWQRRQKKAL